MREEKKQARMREIEAVAYDLLARNGYDGTSMLAVAKAAKASNETMYRWYGDKNGLFLNMVRANAADVRAALDEMVSDGAEPIDILERVAPVLLGMLLGDRAIALNRAAAADASGALGVALVSGGRAEVLPLIERVLGDAVRSGAIVPPKEGALGPLFMHLLVGDQQIRRVIGGLPAPTKEEVAERAAVALAQFRRLCAPGQA